MSVPSVSRVTFDGLALTVSLKQTRAQVVNSLSILHKVDESVEVSKQGLEVGQETRGDVKKICQDIDRLIDQVGELTIAQAGPSLSPTVR